MMAIKVYKMQVIEGAEHRAVSNSGGCVTYACPEEKVFHYDAEFMQICPHSGQAIVKTDLGWLLRVDLSMIQCVE